MSKTSPSVCIFCGSKWPENLDTSALEELINAFNTLDINLYYGGGPSGVMGYMADGMNTVTAFVPPRFDNGKPIDHPNATKPIVKDQHDRYLQMIGADVLLLLPGGAGSMEEFWAAVSDYTDGTPIHPKEHKKPIFVLTLTPSLKVLEDQFNLLCEEDLLYPHQIENVRFFDRVDEMMAAMKAYLT